MVLPEIGDQFVEEAGSVMQIIGLGTDIVETERIGGMLERHGDAFLSRVFTNDEVAYCQDRKNCIQHYAGRWAAKEAVMKTLGTGWSKGVIFHDIEVVSQKSGAPLITLHGGALAVSRELGIQQVLITISHCRAYATATAIAVGQIAAEQTDHSE